MFQRTMRSQLNPLTLPLPKDDSSGQRSGGQTLTHAALDVLNTEIFSRHSSRRVRKAVGSCLEIICTATGQTGAALLQPMMPAIEKKRLVPLRHVEVQIGTALALTFCLRQKPELVKEVSNDLIQILQDALHIAEADDANLSAHMTQIKGDVSATVTRLRMVCVQLLCAAVAWPAFREAAHIKPLRERVIGCFFKSLTSQVSGIASAAREGLRHVTVSQPKNLPKEQLQMSLRPLLMNLANHKSLTLPLLKGLSQLLELLAMWFNPNLGDKLLDHLRNWLEPDKILNEQHSWKAGEEVQVAAGIMDLFHLLPQLTHPESFLETKERPGLVVLMIGLEQTLHKFPSCPAPSKMASPFREPLIKFLNRYAIHSIKYFLAADRMQDPHYFFRFLHFVKAPTGQPLRDTLTEHAEAQERLLDLLKVPAPGETVAMPNASFHAVHLVASVAKLKPQWLATTKPIMERLLERWRSPAREQRIQQEETLGLEVLLETARLAKCLMNYITALHSETVPILYDLVGVFRTRSRVDFTFVADFIKKEVADKFTPEEKRAVVAHLLTMSAQRVKQATVQRAPAVVTDEQLVLGIKHVVVPMLTRAFEKGEGPAILDAASLKSIVADLFDPPEVVASGFTDALSIEVLQLATLLMKHMGERLTPHRKELIKFGWNQLKREDSDCKPFAFVNVCQFLETYQAPDRIILQIFVALLKTIQPDVPKALVNEALDILVPVLPLRMRHLEEQRFPSWIRYAKKMLSEEQHSMPHMLHIWQLVVRHADLFYASRAQFVPQMVNNLSRIGLPQNTVVESRRLSMDLVALIMRWEKQRIANSKAGVSSVDLMSRKRAREPTPPTASALAEPAKEEAPKAEPGEGNAAKPADDAAATGTAPEKPDAAPAEAQPPADPAAEKEKQSDEPPAKLQRIDSALATGDLAAQPSEDLGKALSVPGASPAATPATTPAQRTPSNVPEEEFKVSSSMEEMIVSFLVRITFLLCESRDKDMQGMVGHGQHLLHEALCMWPHVTVKMPYLEKLLQANKQAGMDPAPALINGLQVIDQLLAVNPQGCITNCHQQLLLLLEQCFKSPHKGVVDMLAGIMQKVYATFPLTGAGPPPMAAAVITRVQQLIEAVLVEAADATGRQLPVPNLPGVAASLSVLRATEAGNPIFLTRMVAPVVRMLNNHARQQGSLILQQQQAAQAQGMSQAQAQLVAAQSLQATQSGVVPDPKTAASRPAAAGGKPPITATLLERLNAVDDSKAAEWDPAYGSLTWSMCAALRLAAHRGLVLLHTDHKKLFLHTLVVLITGAKATSPAVLMEILMIVRKWLLEPDTATGCLSVKEAVLFLQRLAQLERSGATQGAIKTEWETNFLSLMHKLCTTNLGPEGEALRRDTFAKVERVFLMGLRACDPSMRHKFFNLYSGSVSRTLFTRLQFIISGQDWEALSNSFWLNQGLDLLLAILIEDEQITLAPNSAQVPPLLNATKQHVFNPSRTDDTKDVPAAAAPEPSAEPPAAEAPAGTVESGAPAAAAETTAAAAEPMQGVLTAADGEHSGLPSKVVKMLRDHNTFLASTGSLKVKHLMRSIRELAHADSAVAYHCWVLVFPIVWATLQKEQQVHLAKPMISLLSKEYHSRQASARPNVVQALLEGISLSQPQPKIPSELIKFLGKNYNSWHNSIPLLESHVMLFQQETRCFDALAELYRQLSETDMLAGLWKMRCGSEETRTGLSLMQQGQLESGQRVFHQAITKASSSRSASLSRGEQALWIDQWLQCSKQLNQWDSIMEFSRDVDRLDTLMDCLWKLPDWISLKQAVLPKAQVEDGPKLMMIKARVKLQEGGVSEAQELINHASVRLLQQWWQLPEVGVTPTLPFLESLQPLVELHESSRILVDLSVLQQQHRSEHLYSDLKDIMETWRLRLPNEWEALSHWGDVLIWRNHIYNIIINALNEYQELLPQLHQAGYRDKAWSVNQLGAAARKQYQYNTCISSINKLYGFNRMDVQEAFVKIKEQAKAYLAGGEETITGLNLITTTNLEYFTPEHQSEIFRLKGLFHQALGEHGAANNAFSTSLSLHRQLPEAWLSWGTFNDMMYASSGDKAYLESCAACYLQAIRFGSTRGRGLLPRLLHLLSFENEGGEVGRALDRQGDMPLWALLVWIPQLLMGLQRPEVMHIKRLLVQLAVVYPQALYYSLRTFLLTLRETAVKPLQEYTNAARGAKAAVEKAKAAEAAKQAAVQSGDAAKIQAETAAATAAAQAAHAAQAGLPEKPAEVVAFEAGREVMEALRSKHGPLVQVLENLLTEIGSRFVPKPAERLLAVVHMLLHRCYKAPCANIAEVPASLKKELGGVCKACFSSEQVSKHGWEMQQHREAFVRDLDPESECFPTSLGKLVERLKGWKATLQTAVEDYMPPILKLEDESRSLQDLSTLDVEMPGQYLSGEHNGASDKVVKLERIGADVNIVRRHGSSYRRLKMYGSDGHVRFFLVQTPGTGHWSSTATSDERVLQLLRMYNQLLDRHPESRRRHLKFHTPAIVTIWPQVRLLEEEPSYCSCGEAYEVNCARYGREPDLPIIHFKDQCCGPNGQLLQDPNGELRLKAYQAIESGVVSENVLSQYMYKTLPTCNHLWTFKKQFCSQMSLSAVLCHMLQLGGRSPNKILFAKNSGLAFQMDLYPVYDNRGLLECNEPVRFRLTRNLQTFFTPFGVDGVFVGCMASASGAGMQPQNNLRHILSMFFRDDIMSAQQRRSNRGATGGTPSGLMSQDLKTVVVANVEQCIKRLDMMAPPQKPNPSAPADPHRGAAQLVKEALSPRNLCRMEPTWHPWF